MNDQQRNPPHTLPLGVRKYRVHVTPAVLLL